MDTQAFVPGRSQDASPTIQGFVYQVRVTILRWLQLETNQVLQLECGEDIDVFSRAVDAQEDERVRLLEQVKQRSRRLTLRSADAISAIANFLQHRSANPTMDLFCRYTTTAGVGHEKLSGLTSGVAGIHAWEQVRRGELEEELRDQTLNEIRRILKGASQPSGVNKSSWEEFESWIRSASNNELRGFVERFEWATRQFDPSALELRLIDLLAGRDGIADDTAAREVYKRLFYRVFAILCRRDIKELTPSTLEEELRLPTLTDTDRERLQKLETLLNVRLATLETRLDEHQIAIEHLGQRAGIETQALSILQSVETTPPVPLRNLSPRRSTVQTLLERMSGRTWTVLIGGSGEGKTQLALLVAKEAGGIGTWVKLTDRSPGQCHDELKRLAVVIAQNNPPSGAGGGPYTALCRHVGRGRVLVLDDVPQLSGNEDFAGELLFLFEQCKETGVVLFSTGSQDLPTRLREKLDSAHIFRTPIPPFTDEEALDVLRSYGAPDPQQFSQLVNAVCRGHPTLVAAAARYLQQQSWRMDLNTLEKLFRGVYADEVQTEAFRRLVDQVTTRECRDLLCRLSLAASPVTLQEIRSVSHVEPELPRYVECCTELTGVWLQEEPRGSFSVSPLVKTLSMLQVADETRKAVHEVLGELLIRRQRLDIHTAQLVVVHFLQAENFNRAGIALLQLLQEAQKSEPLTDDLGLLVFFPPDKPLPDNMDLALRVLLRSAQLGFAKHVGRNPLPYIAEIDILADACGADEQWAALMSAVQVVLTVEQTGVPAVLPSLRRVARYSTVRLPNGEPIPFPQEQGGALFLLWLAANFVDEEQALWFWLEAVEQLQGDDLLELFSLDLAAEHCLRLADRFWLPYDGAARGDEVWTRLQNFYDSIIDWAQKHGVRLLATCSVAAKIVIHGEQLQDLKQAEDCAAAALDSLEKDDPDRFLIEERLGTQYLRFGEHSKARACFETALACVPTRYPLRRREARLKACEVHSALNTGEQINLARQAVEVTPEDREGQFRALMFLAVSHWEAGDQRAAFASAERAALLVSEADLDEHMKWCFKMLGHAVGYYASMVTRGQPPKSAGDGEYVKPNLGMFRAYQPQVAQLFEPRDRAFLPFQFALFAMGIQNDSRASWWLDEAYEQAREVGTPILFNVLALHVITALLLRDDYGAAIDLALLAGKTVVATDDERAGGRDPLRSDYCLEEILKKRDPEFLVRAEQVATRYVLVQLAVRVIGLVNEGRSRGEQAALRIAELLETVAEDASSGDDWKRAAKLFRALVEDRIRSLTDYCNTLPVDESVILRSAGYFLVSVHRDSDAQNSIRAQLAVLPAVWGILLSDTLGLRLFVAPSLTAMWERTFANGRFQFAAPRQVEQRLLEAGEVDDPSKRLKATLSAIASGLEVHVHSGARQWLEGDD